MTSNVFEPEGFAPSERTHPSLLRSAVLTAFRSMRHGQLTMTLPGGERRIFGDGSNPRGARFGLQAEVRVLREDFFRRCFFYGDIGFAEAYMAGDWTTDDLAEVVSWAILNDDPSRSQSSARNRQRILNGLGWINHLAHRLRRNSIGQSRINIAAHYDLSNDLFALFLDPSMTYSSGLFDASGERSLEEAQQAKYARIAGLLELREGDRVLEIGGAGAPSAATPRRPSDVTSPASPSPGSNSHGLNASATRLASRIPSTSD
jgi:Cyclopropane fatty acid synthase and related methyltransferases